MLTKSDGKGGWWLPGVRLVSLPAEVYQAIAKLHAYELTGLNPDEVSSLKLDNEELKEKLSILDKKAHWLEGQLELCLADKAGSTADTAESAPPAKKKSTGTRKKEQNTDVNEGKKA